MEYDGVVFVPEGRNDTWAEDYALQLETEELMLRMADCIVAWIPRELTTMPGFTTNDEFGTWKYSGKVVLGAPPDAPKVRYQRYYATKLGIPSFTTLNDTLACAVSRLNTGARRYGGARFIPLEIWHTESFQRWYANLRAAGNRLHDAKVEWTFRVGPARSSLFAWAIHVDIYVAAEQRHRSNEFVLGRSDISSVVAYCPGGTLADTDVVLVKEFRAPVSNTTGFVWELPSGSSFKAGVRPEQLAADELREETGLTVEPQRFEYHESRQMAATFACHRAHLFSVELTPGEMYKLRRMRGAVFGEKGSTERTYLEVQKIRDLLTGDIPIDWSMLGMILSVIQK
jgi:8-oxo-dGTP pyrophosphatase MutT (NUDIX family)